MVVNALIEFPSLVPPRMFIACVKSDVASNMVVPARALVDNVGHARHTHAHQVPYCMREWLLG